jgi:hypothetical protein
MGFAQKEVVEELRIQWKKLWQERTEDKERAEGIATSDYHDLFVERGTVIHATRNFKSLNFKEILEKHKIANADRIIIPNPNIGGWTKFIKMNVTNQRSRKRNREEFYCDENKHEKQQQKKGGKGWLHRSS